MDPPKSGIAKQCDRSTEPSSHYGLCQRDPEEELLVNAAYLLLTSAWMAGADPAPAAPAAAAPVVSTGSCCGGCSTSCGNDCCRPSLFDRLRSWGRRNNCCDSGCNRCNTCNTGCHTHHHASCCTPAPTCCAPVQSCCDNGCRSRFSFNWGRNNCCDNGCGHHHKCHDSCNTCNSCGHNDCCRTSLFDRLRSSWGHRNNCCDSGCGGCGGC